MVTPVKLFISKILNCHPSKTGFKDRSKKILYLNSGNILIIKRSLVQFIGSADDHYSLAVAFIIERQYIHVAPTRIFLLIVNLSPATTAAAAVLEDGQYWYCTPQKQEGCDVNIERWSSRTYSLTAFACSGYYFSHRRRPLTNKLL